MIYLASWIPVMNAWVLLVFMLGFVGLLFQVALNGGNSYFFGIPAQNQSLMLMPLISLGLTILTVIYAGLGWAGRYWSTPRKIYYSLLALSSVASVVMLGMSGMLTVLLG
jgi:hypothetical protein